VLDLILALQFGAGSNKDSTEFDGE
jgi:hypothetical protein